MHWLCAANGSWHSAGPDTSNCHSRAIEQLLDTAHERQPLALAQETATLTANLTLQPGDLPLVITKLLPVDAQTDPALTADAGTPPSLASLSDSEELLKSVAQTSSNLFDAKQRAAWDGQPNRTELVCRIIDSVESAAFALARRIAYSSDSQAANKSQSATSMVNGSLSDAGSVLQLPPTVVTLSVEVQVRVVTLDKVLQSMPESGAGASEATGGQQQMIVDGFSTSTAQNPESAQTAAPVRLNVNAYVEKYLPDTAPSTDLAVVFARYRNVAEYVDSSPSSTTSPFTMKDQPQEESQLPPKPNRVKSALLITDIISASVQRIDRSGSSSGSSRSALNAYENTDRRVLVEFELSHSTNISGERICAFWYSESQNGESGGYWSDAGCWRLSEPSTGEQQSNRTRCACSHLTNFAVLLDTSGVLRREPLSEENDIALTMLTLIGCGLSSVASLLAFILFSITKVYQGRFPERNTIHKNVCINLCIAQVCLLVNIIAHSALDPTSCTILGVFQHLFFLVTFSWIALEGVQLFIMLVIVFETKRSLKPVFYSVGYGLPTLIVALSVAIRPTGYVNEKMCWLTPDDGFMWAFAGPVALVLAINYIVFAVSWITIGRHSARRARRSDSNRPCIAEQEPVVRRGSCSTSSTPQTASASTRISTSSPHTAAAVRSWLKGASVLCVLLGLTWVFGFVLWTSPNVSIVFAYLFTIFNSVQGTFILLLHFLIDAKVRSEAWSKVHRSRFVRWLSRASSRSSRSSSVKPPGPAGQAQRSSSSGRMSGLLKNHRSSNAQSNTPSSFNTILSLFGRRIALRRTRKPPRSTDGSSDDSVQKRVSETAKEKLLAGQIIVDPERLEAKVREQRFGNGYQYQRASDVAGELDQFHAKFLNRYLAEPEDFAVSNSFEPSSVVSCSNSNSQVSESDAQNSTRLSSTVSRTSSSISPFPTQYPPTYAQATECAQQQPLAAVQHCRTAAPNRYITLVHNDSAYGTQPNNDQRKRATVTNDKRKYNIESEASSQLDSEALSSYCDSRILTEFAEPEDANSHRHRHNHKCGCERTSSLKSTDLAKPTQYNARCALDRSDSLNERRRADVDSETEDELALWRDGIADSVSNVNESDVMSKDRSMPYVPPRSSKRTSNLDKAGQSRLSALLTVVAEKDFESDVSDGELFNLTATPQVVVDCRENDAFECSNSNSVGEDVHASV